MRYEGGEGVKRLRVWWGLGGLALALLLTGVVGAQAEARLRIAQVDTAAFPTVRLNVIASDEALSPITDLSALTLTEADQSISDLTLTRVPVGVEMIFVIDADDSLLQTDGGNALSRREIVRDAILRYAAEYMNPAGRDRVSIIIPDGQEGALLLERASAAAQVAEAIDAYEPTELPLTTPLAAMMDLALGQATAGAAEGRFQAVLLFTNGGEMAGQLDVAAFNAAAQGLSLPVFAGILGARADANEIANVEQLTEPGRAFWVHMPASTDADPIYTTIQAHATQTQISYPSNLRRGGSYTVTVSLGDAQANRAFSLTIEPPQLQLISSNAQPLQRVGQAADTPLFQLQPADMTLQARVRWPDGHARALSQVTLLVDGVESLPQNAPEVDADGILQLVWDIGGLDAGVYAVTLQVADVFGYTAQTEPVPFTIAVSRPQPTVAPTPTATPPPPPTASAARLVASLLGRLYAGMGGMPALLTVGLGVAAVGVLVLLLRLRRRRQRQPVQNSSVADRLDALLEPATTPALVEEEADAPVLAPTAGPHLVIQANGEPQEGDIFLTGGNVTMGRDPELVDVVFAHRSVSRLHARIKQSEGRFWLYDEGSATGTYLNYVRVGLMPQPLQDRDEVHVGQVHLRFFSD